MLDEMRPNFTPLLQRFGFLAPVIRPDGAVLTYCLGGHLLERVACSMPVINLRRTIFEHQAYMAFSVRYILAITSYAIRQHHETSSWHPSTA